VVFNNTSGYYDPDNTSAGNPWVVSGTNILRDGLQMRIVATIGGTAYNLYYGFLEETKVNQGEAPSVSMTFVDGIAYIADAQAPALATAGFAETAATRVGRMLTYGRMDRFNQSYWHCWDACHGSESFLYGADLPGS
jgi:hypothetical protein